jgi:hypothetical protein
MKLKERAWRLKRKFILWLAGFLFEILKHKIATRPNEIIQSDKVYMERWYLLPKWLPYSLYLHQFWNDDDDRALHDHPADSISFIIHGGYIEVTQRDLILYQKGDIIKRKATDAHRLEILKSKCTSLFFMGRRYREWGFLCPNYGTSGYRYGFRWVPWYEFVDQRDKGRIGKGYD